MLMAVLVWAGDLSWWLLWLLFALNLHGIHLCHVIHLPAEGQLLKLPANKFTVREREMLIGSGILPPEFFQATRNPFVIGVGARKLGERGKGRFSKGAMRGRGMFTSPRSQKNVFVGGMGACSLDERGNWRSWRQGVD